MAKESFEIHFQSVWHGDEVNSLCLLKPVWDDMMSNLKDADEVVISGAAAVFQFFDRDREGPRDFVHSLVESGHMTRRELAEQIREDYRTLYTGALGVDLVNVPCIKTEDGTVTCEIRLML